MRTRSIAVALVCGVLLAGIPAGLQAADKKSGPGEARNDDVAIESTLVLDHDEVQQILGSEISPGYVLARIKVIPQTERPLRIGPDNFTLIWRKNGERSPALTAGEIAGSGALVVHTERTGSIGVAKGDDVPTDVKTISSSSDAPNPLLDVLEARILPDKESVQPVEGLLYFVMDGAVEGKLRPKDVSLLYRGPAGRLTIDFK